MFKEFREFISKGSVLDLAIGIIIGAAFTGIVSSFVKDILTPIIGVAGKANFDNLFIVLKQGDVPGPYATPELAQKVNAVTMNYGTFLNSLINFLIVAFVLFLVVRAANRMKKAPAEAPAAPAAPSDETRLLAEIRDLLQHGR